MRFCSGCEGQSSKQAGRSPCSHGVCVPVEGNRKQRSEQVNRAPRRRQVLGREYSLPRMWRRTGVEAAGLKPTRAGCALNILRVSDRRWPGSATEAGQVSSKGCLGSWSGFVSLGWVCPEHCRTCSVPGPHDAGGPTPLVENP